jgi:hypothetical protein
MFKMVYITCVTLFRFEAQVITIVVVYSIMPYIGCIKLDMICLYV